MSQILKLWNPDPILRRPREEDFQPLTLIGMYLSPWVTAYLSQILIISVTDIVHANAVHVTTDFGAAEVTHQVIYVQIIKTRGAQNTLPYPTVQPIHIRTWACPLHCILMTAVPKLIQWYNINCDSSIASEFMPELVTIDQVEGPRLIEETCYYKSLF